MVKHSADILLTLMSTLAPFVASGGLAPVSWNDSLYNKYIFSEQEIAKL
jgi:hypothetical protein